MGSFNQQNTVLTLLVVTALTDFKTFTFSVTFAMISCDKAILAMAVASVSSSTFRHNPNGVLETNTDKCFVSNFVLKIS